MRNVIKWAIGIGCACAVGLAIGLGVGLSGGSDEADPPMREGGFKVETENGPVIGFEWDPNEKMEGVWANKQHNSVSFKGIPYAQPPVGNLRWRHPRPVESWEKPIEAKNFRSICPQKCHGPPGSCDISEDCLYLNVYVEKRTLPSANVRDGRKVPVAIWFHGGAFAWGSGSSPLYDGKFITERMDMVVVTVNYRLSAFGFLALEMNEDERSHANVGFGDQQLAVEWVRQNIEQFGGDSEKIMIFGQSAGGVSTTLHLLETPGINSVNIHSNPLAIPVKEHWEGQRQFQQFAELAGCYDSDDRMGCLRKIPMYNITHDIVPNMPTIHSPRLLLAAMPFSPVIDHVIIKKQPYIKLMEGDYDQSRNIMIGNTEHETEIFIRSIWPKGPINGATYELAVRAIIQHNETADAFLEQYPAACKEDKPSGKSISVEDCKKGLCDALGLEGVACSAVDGTLTTLCEAVNTNLPCIGDDGPDERDTFEEPGTEWIFSCPTNQILQKASKPTYRWHFRAPMIADISQVGGFQGIPDTESRVPSFKSALLGKIGGQNREAGADEYENCKYMSCHAAELSYIFAIEEQFDCKKFDEIHGDDQKFIECDENNNVLPYGMTSENMQLLERFMSRYWANFARTGDPNDSTGAQYSEEQKAQYEKDGSLPKWDAFGNELTTLHLGYNTRTPGYTGNDDQLIVEEKNWKKDICEFWDSLDIYANH
ncbi:Oidioi.mRNA.OKI2018_I69.chr1.g915.t1.cds [Oikopleura dioica]|uniref:Oidioi.mRNA.OKI2018_I69.chr1.g915.t1.cds n=1 Tax=Oikopleura dioica TaxID=34765 RepID=A0ABN7SQ06_OIKDI|nr:Oidioi.mRNA.OKI2018_I69.chr1.g915.t1.cds [Oikopleura dioica]